MQIDPIQKANLGVAYIMEQVKIVALEDWEEYMDKLNNPECPPEEKHEAVLRFGAKTSELIREGKIFTVEEAAAAVEDMLANHGHVSLAVMINQIKVKARADLEKIINK